MSDLSPAVGLDEDEDEEFRLEFQRDQRYCMDIWAELVNNTVATLKQYPITVGQLPAVNGAVDNLWFAAYRRGQMYIDSSADRAWNGSGAKYLPSAAIRKPMVVSAMRGSGSDDRTDAVQKVDAGSTSGLLWVTEMQNGCTVLILDWGKGRYSLAHLQPSEDTQFNSVGQTIMGLGGYTRRLTGDHFFKNLYKNTWLKQETSSVAGSTGGKPQGYIMVQSMFEASRGKQTQVIGVRRGSTFTFYRQRVYRRTIEVDVLKWAWWWSWLPAITSRTY